MKKALEERLDRDRKQGVSQRTSLTNTDLRLQDVSDFAVEVDAEKEQTADCKPSGESRKAACNVGIEKRVESTWSRRRQLKALRKSSLKSTGGSLSFFELALQPWRRYTAVSQPWAPQQRVEAERDSREPSRRRGRNAEAGSDPIKHLAAGVRSDAVGLAVRGLEQRDQVRRGEQSGALLRQCAVENVQIQSG